MPEQIVPGLRYNWLPSEEKLGRAIERLEDEVRTLAAQRDRYRDALWQIAQGHTPGGYVDEPTVLFAEAALNETALEKATKEVQ